MIAGMPVDRRELLKWSALLPVAMGAPQSALASALEAVPEGVDALVIDQRHVPPGMDLAGMNVAGKDLAGFSGRTLYRITGDVTQLWYETLDPIWRQPGFVLGGITGSDALFVLETLARDRGRRVVQRRVLSPADSGPQAVSWVIAPHHPSVLASDLTKAKG